MKFPLLPILLPFLGTSLDADEVPIEGQLRFPNGDSLQGQPTGLTEDGFLLWQSDLFQDQQERFRINSADAILLRSGNSRPLEDASPTQATITFQTHVDESVDTLHAELLSFDEETVEVKTWYGGDLTLKRSMLDRIEVEGKSTPLITGPGVLADWKRPENEDAWTIDSGILTSTERGTIAREFSQLPDKVHCSFELEFDSSPYLRIYFFASSGDETYPDDCYSIQLQRGGGMNFGKRVDERPVPLQGELFGARHRFPTNNFAVVDLYADRENGLLALYIDGEEIAVARDKEPLREGDWWLFNTMSTREQSLHDFTISPWNGKLPEKASFLAARAELPGEDEAIELQNGDTILGTARDIEEGKLRVETEYVPISVPVERLRSLKVTAPEDREEPRIYAGDVRAYFKAGGFVTLRLSDITPTSISGYSQVFGDATFNLRVFSQIHFNPYDDDFRERRGETF
jgi:hypothetical protein